MADLKLIHALEFLCSEQITFVDRKKAELVKFKGLLTMQ